MGTAETMGLKKKQGVVWEDVLMSRKWGGIKADGGGGWGTRQKCRKLQLRE
jgi:hypothetical protein